MASMTAACQEAFLHMDRNDFGVLWRSDIIYACQHDEQVAGLLRLPRHVRHQGTSRENFEAVLQRLDWKVDVDEFERFWTSAVVPFLWDVHHYGTPLTTFRGAATLPAPSLPTKPTLLPPPRDAREFAATPTALTYCDESVTDRPYGAGDGAPAATCTLPVGIRTDSGAAATELSCQPTRPSMPLAALLPPTPLPKPSLAVVEATGAEGAQIEARVMTALAEQRERETILQAQVTALHEALVANGTEVRVAQYEPQQSAQGALLSGWEPARLDTTGAASHASLTYASHAGVEAVAQPVAPASAPGQSHAQSPTSAAPPTFRKTPSGRVLMDESEVLLSSNLCLRCALPPTARDDARRCAARAFALSPCVEPLR